MTVARYLAKSSVATACAVLLGVSPALAERGLAPEVTVESCARFTAEQIRELVDLELSTDANGLSQAPRYLLAIQCNDALIELKLLDEKREVQMERTIEQPDESSTEPERTVALAGAELVFALGWMPHPPQQSVPPAQTGSTQISAKQEDAGGYRNYDSSHRATLRASYLLALRSLDTTPFLASSAVISAQLQLKVPVRFGVTLGYEVGSSTSQNVISQVVSGGAQLGYALALSSDVDLAFEFEVRALHVNAKRKQWGPLPELSVSGWQPDFIVRVGPEWVPGTWGLAMSLNGGFTAGQLELPEVRPTPYSFGGAWVGISMDLLLNGYFGGEK